MRLNTAISTLTLPPATGGNGTLTYSLAPTLPNGLSFDPNRQTFGTPTTAQAATPYPIHRRYDCVRTEGVRKCSRVRG